MLVIYLLTASSETVRVFVTRIALKSPSQLNTAMILLDSLAPGGETVKLRGETVELLGKLSRLFD